MSDLRRVVGTLDNLVAFEAAARHNNFSRAAGELLVAQPAISRRIQQLEESLGATLFARNGTRVTLTAAGTQLQSVVTTAFRSIEQCAKALPRDDDGVVSLRVNVAAASLWLMPALGAFYASFPDIRLHLVCIDELPEFGGGDFDLEIRFGLGDWPGVTSYPLLSETIYPVASAEFCRNHAITSLDDLSRVPLLQLANFTSPLMDWKGWLSDDHVPIIRYFTTYAMVLEAAHFGHGVALGWHAYVRPAVEKGDLIRLPIEERKSTYREFLVVRPAAAQRSPVERTQNWLLELAARDEQL
ncbi:LysR substrate-binding domain-containing protein [Bosea sp. (in: a-proteobacteria)]|uniref:LysR substrate-binding domain-containing protein n=1 Tax=Bosea sp. (in: a-proteobacteria) TaxID=1871050 RepID=UPI001AC1C979|nr:LysR substrate-binding domain-containing protein [Bosea sp. (in: a-proteobacteria)]MBN9441892.1 LysR family transcriptional regulator [Bosea sp. (in: a-proteobacteria)]